MGKIGTFSIGRTGLPVTLLSSPPTVTITSPGTVVITSTITATWTYSSALSRPQESYRVALLNGSGTSVLYDSGTLTGTNVSHAIDFSLEPQSSYIVRVIASDGISAGLADQTFLVDIASADEADDNLNVGSLYEIAINGVGYMLADHPESGTRYRRTVGQLDPQRLATGDTPFSEAVERYTFVGHSDWTGGSGQLFLNRTTSDPSRYYYSEGVNPFEQGSITCLTAPSLQISDTYTNQLATVAGGNVYVLTATAELTSRDAPGGANTTFVTGLAGTVSSLASDGNNWYATDGASIRRNSAAATPGADWSTVDVTEIAWIGDRLGGLDTATGPNFTTFTDAGVEENVGGWQTFTGASLRGLTGGDGYAWFGVNRNDTGHVRAWQLDSAAGSTFVALSLPAGEIVDNVFFYLGNVMVAARTQDTFDIKIYRCIPNEGKLTPQLVTKFNNFFFPSKVFFAGRDRFVAWAWPDMQRDHANGIGVLDLESGGYARWNSDGTVTGRDVQGVVSWEGGFGFTVEEVGFYGIQASTVYRTGFLETSTADLQTSVGKVFDEVSVQTLPLPTTTSVAVAYSVDSNSSFTTLGTLSGAGAKQGEFDAGVSTQTVGLRLTLTPVTSNTPTVKMVVAKTHPQGLRDEIVTLAVNCADQLQGLNGNLLPESAPGAGVRRATTLMGLVSSNVKLQDIDWPVIGVSQTWQVIAGDMTSAGTFDRFQNRRVDHPVVQLQLRRPA